MSSALQAPEDVHSKDLPTLGRRVAGTMARGHSCKASADQAEIAAECVRFRFGLSHAREGPKELIATVAQVGEGKGERDCESVAGEQVVVRRVGGAGSMAKGGQGSVASINRQTDGVSTIGCSPEG